jgi:hypothetical protein
MLFRYYSLSDDGGLDPIGDWDFTGDFVNVKSDVEKQFEAYVATMKCRQILVLTTSIGDKPGRIVAAEAVYMAHVSGKVKPEVQARSLVWLVEDYVPKH